MSDTKPRIHLLANAHLDPVWLWEWEEGAAEAISTFRTAADFCDEYDDFVFNHNEAVLYEWVEEYEPALFARIQRLVKAGRWHIMGGWFLQPDCNMPCGESFVRQILYGRRYFQEKFGKRPTTAINFDPFGHTRGLVQILAKAGFDSYFINRPQAHQIDLDHEFVWVGYDGSEVLTSSSRTWYNTHLGKAEGRLDDIIENFSDVPVLPMQWGIGNHGGGPSRLDLTRLNELIEERKDDAEIIHSSMEEYFADVRTHMKDLPRRESDLNPFAVGCYTSQVRIKQLHRRLENDLFMTEKMATAAHWNGLMAYPAEELRQAERDLLFSQFHDILPGSSIQPVEEAALRLLDHGLEILSRVKTRAFFALAAGQPKGNAQNIPVLIFNPHPFDVTGIFTCEFQLENQNWTGTWTDIDVYQGRKSLPSQVEKEASNLPLDWRKKVAFQATLKAGQMNRFDCKLVPLADKPAPALKPKGGKLTFDNGEMRVVINSRTGFVDSYRVAGEEMLRKNAFRPLVIEDNEDPWGMTRDRFDGKAEPFKLMSAQESTRFSGVETQVLPPVRVVEDGDARTVVEALFTHGRSACVLTYSLPKQGTQFEIHARVFWMEKDSMLKLSVPVSDKKARLLGQVAYGCQDLGNDGQEKVAQKWCAAISEAQDTALTCVNDGTYGLDLRKGELRLSLLRAAAYSGHPIGERMITPQDRFTPRIDQGERHFRFWINAGPTAKRLETIDREALALNEKPMALSFFPPAQGEKPNPAIVLSDKAVQLTALRYSENKKNIIARLFEPTGKKRKTTLKLHTGESAKIEMTPYEIKTISINAKTGKWKEAGLEER